MAGVHDSYLAPREAVVVVEGARSEPYIIADMVFQGTVLGPMLWNMFLADISTFTASIGYDEERFADDLSISKDFDKSMDNADIIVDLHRSQESVHEWGRAYSQERGVASTR